MTAKQPETALIPTVIPPAPVPHQIAVDVYQRFVILRIQDQTGVKLVFLHPNQAGQLSTVLRDASSNARGGLVVPTPVVKP